MEADESPSLDFSTLDTYPTLLANQTLFDIFDSLSQDEDKPTDVMDLSPLSI
jgi:hypothetical protein